MLDFTLFTLDVSVHSAPSFSVFDSVCVWKWGSAGKYVILTQFPFECARHTPESHAAQVSFQERSCPKECSWLAASGGVSQAALNEQAQRWQQGPPYLDLCTRLFRWDGQLPSPDALQSEALPSSPPFLPPLLFTDVRPARQSEGSPCRLLLLFLFIFLR